MPSPGHHTLSAFFTRDVESRVLGLTFAPAAFARILVLAESEKSGLSQLAVGGPLVEGDLRHELGADPRRVTQARGGVERRGLRAQPAQLRAEFAQRLGREAGADLAGVAQTIAVVEADQQCAELGAGTFGRRVSADHELRLLAHFHLQPIARAHAGLVCGPRVFGDDALPALGSGAGVRLLTVAGHAAAQQQQRLSPGHECFESGAPLVERSRKQALPPRLEQVEHGVAEAHALLSSTLKELKARDVVPVERDQLAVEHQLLARQRGHVPRYFGEVRGDVTQRSRVQPGATALPYRERADAVVLLLEDPLRSARHLARERGQHRRERPQCGSPLAAFSTSPPPSRAIVARSRRVRTDRGLSTVISTSFEA